MNGTDSLNRDSVPGARNETSVNRSEIIDLIRNELKQAETRSNNNDNENRNPPNSVVQDLSQKIRVELVGKDSGKREYKLTNQTKFVHFMDFLMSELRTIDLLYIVDPNEKPNFTVDDSTKEKHTFKVRDILINRLDQNYYSQIDQIKDPVEILSKIREIKRCETNLTSMTICKRLCNMEYDPNKERAAEFWDHFEELVRNYDILPNVNPLSDDEKKDAFSNAISTAIPQIEFMDFMTSNSTGKGLTYDQLKAFIVRHEANKIQTSETRPAALNVRKHDAKNRCYSCGGQGHRSNECHNEGKLQCYECRKIEHIARVCFVKLAKQKEQAATNKPSSSSNNNEQACCRANNNKRGFGGKRKSNGAGNDSYVERAKNSDNGSGGRQYKKKDEKGNRDDPKENQNGDKQARKGNIETRDINITGYSAASVREQTTVIL